MDAIKLHLCEQTGPVLGLKLEQEPPCDPPNEGEQFQSALVPQTSFVPHVIVVHDLVQLSKAKGTTVPYFPDRPRMLSVMVVGKGTEEY